jgi:acetyltransferase-like isoleucine patch superfamily enzyme
VIDKLCSIRRYPEFMRLLWWRMVVPRQVRMDGIDLGAGVAFFGRPIVSMSAGSGIRIGARSMLCSVSRFTALGVNHPVVLRTLRPGARLEIGDDVGISGGSICAATSIKIGDACLLGANVTIVDTDFHAIKPDNRRYNDAAVDIASAPVSIGNNVFIGTGTIVLKGVTIGDNSIIGAHSVVATSIPANVMAGGNPARVIRELAMANETE